MIYRTWYDPPAHAAEPTSGEFENRALLKPCPLCGTYAEYVTKGVTSHIRCGNIYNCDCETRLGPTAWNRRATSPLPPTQGDEETALSGAQLNEVGYPDTRKMANEILALRAQNAALHQARADATKAVQEDILRWAKGKTMLDEDMVAEDLEAAIRARMKEEGR